MSRRTLQRACLVLALGCCATACHSPPGQEAGDREGRTPVDDGGDDQAKAPRPDAPGDRPTDAEARARAICQYLRGCDGKTDHRAVVAKLDGLRALGPRASGAARALSELLAHRSPLYRDRDKGEVVRLRSYILVTLSDTAVPPSSERWLADTLENFDERLMAVEIGSAVRAAGTLGQAGQRFVPCLVSLLSTSLSEEEFTLVRYEQEFTRGEATTIKIEAIRALGRICTPRDVTAVGLLRALAGADAMSEADGRASNEACAALDAIRQRAPSGTAWASDERGEFVTPGTPPDHRRGIRYPGTRFEDQDGRRGVIGDLAGKPLLIAFFYSRCQNGAKCSSAVANMAALQNDLKRLNLSDHVRLVLITYEPQLDTPARLHQFGADRGFVFGDNALAIRLEQSEHERFVHDIEAPVNFNAGWVNTHGIELILIDARAKLVRKYQTLLWDNDQVAGDVQRLLEER